MRHDAHHEHQSKGDHGEAKTVLDLLDDGSFRHGSDKGYPLNDPEMPPSFFLSQ